MSREEVEKILSEGTTNPRYKVALDIAKQNGWVNDINTTDAKLPTSKAEAAAARYNAKPGVQALSNEKTGFIPIDTSAPTERQQAIMDDMKSKEAAGFLETGGVGTTTAKDLVAQKDALQKAEDLDMSGETTVEIPETNAQKKVEELNNPFQVGEESKIENTEAKANAVAQPSKNDTPVETKAKNKYRNQSMSIWDAYYNGEFGEPGSDEAKATRNYFIVDAIANFAKNTGRSIGNIGAQYSGGTIDNGHDESKWEEIRNTLGGEELTVAREQLGGPAERRATSELLQNKLSALSANRAATVNDLINEVKAAADSATNETMKKSYLALAAMLSGANMNGVSLGATAATGLIEDIMNAIGGNK